MKPTLLIMAAGMGSRYGGLKQLDTLGPNGETIMDYSVYDAIRAGFEDVVFVVRESFKKEFEEKVTSKYKDIIKTTLVTQELEDLPEGFVLPPQREKPWGTGQAVLSASNVINRPFAVINADDYYGPHSFKVLADFLNSLPEDSVGKYCMVGFELYKTLSDSGTVSRGICNTDSNNYLTYIEEHTNIEKKGDIIKGQTLDGKDKIFDNSSCASMNMWGFTKDFLTSTHNKFITFLKNNINEPKKEFYVPSVVGEMIQNKEASVKVLETTDNWFGVTYKDDRENVVAELARKTKEGIYPSPLF